jgi:hypothetical integral membrane protein (TIGR02206 family)
MSGGQSWQHHFVPFSLTHLCVVVGFGILVTAVVTMRRCDEVAEDPERRRLADRSFGWLTLGLACFVQVATLWPSRFDYRTSLPLHICDIEMFLAPCALLLRWRWLRDMAYFWGLGISSLSFVYPDLAFGPADFQFWVFWAGHAAIISSAIYDISARCFRPHWRDWFFAVKFSIVYVLIIFPIDAIFGINYGYIGKSYHGQRSPVDFLGPWPYRVPIMLVAGIFVMFLLLLPWMFGRKNFMQGIRSSEHPTDTAKV